MNTKFGELTDIDKSALFIAWTEDRVIQFRGDTRHKWQDVITPNWYVDYQYRIKPKEPANTIDWSLIHPDFKYLAMDRDIDWYLFKELPSITNGKNWQDRDLSHVSLKLTTFTFFKPNPVDWKDSLITRPDIT